MKLRFSFFLILSCCCQTVYAQEQKNTFSLPETIRQQTIQQLRVLYPNISLDAYQYGAFAFNSDAKAQYDNIMEFPPFENQLQIGKNLWEAPFQNGKTYAHCFPHQGKNIAGNYPYFDEKKQKVITFEMALNQCRMDNGEKPYAYQDKTTMGLLAVYARSLSDGMPIHIVVKTQGAQAAFEKGKNFYYTRRGQLNFSCASCHVQNAGKRLRSETLSSLIGQVTQFPVFRGGDQVTTLHMRYDVCLKQLRAEPLPFASEDYNNLEYFQTYMSNGFKIKAGVFRK